MKAYLVLHRVKVRERLERRNKRLEQVSVANALEVTRSGVGEVKPSYFIPSSYIHSMAISIRGIVFVVAQFSLLGWMLKRTNWHLIEAPRPLAFVVAAAALLAWAVWAMRKSRLRVLPEPHPSAKLIMEGPYRFIRHPMYTSVLLGAGALISTNNNLDMLVAWIALFFVLWSKLGYEERLLLQRFASYQSYQRRTGRLLPFL